jgi:uncharacterized protein
MAVVAGVVSVKIRIDDITAEAKELSFQEAQTQVNLLLESEPLREYRIEGPIDVKVSYYRAGTELFFAGSLHASTHAVCARCAEEFVLPSERAFRFVLTPRAAGFGEEADLHAEDLELSLYEGDEIDLSPLVREQFLLSLPTRPLCADECRGLCPHCGINLNLAQCGCGAEPLDPRFAQLRGLKLGRS